MPTYFKKLCKDRGIAINKLDVMSDVKQSTLDNIVRGLTKNPRVKTLHKIALAFNMTLAEFLDFDELNDYSFDDDSDDEKQNHLPERSSAQAGGFAMR